MTPTPTNASEGLASCPFCGERVIGIARPGGLRVQCPPSSTCGGALVDLWGSRTEEEARRRWNTRATLSPPSRPGRVEIKVGDPDYERFNLTVSDEARERLAQKPSAAPLDCAVGALPSLEVERLREALTWFVRHGPSLEADVRSGHRARGNGAGEAMRDDDRDFRRDLGDAIERGQAALFALPPLEDRREEAGR